MNETFDGTILHLSIGSAPALCCSFSKAGLHCTSLCCSPMPSLAWCHHRSWPYTGAVVPSMDGKVFLPKGFSCLTEVDATGNYFIAILVFCG